jgi:hypothetical protein
MTLAPVVETSTEDYEPAFPIAAVRRLLLILLAGFSALAGFLAAVPAPTGAARPSCFVTLR